MPPLLMGVFPLNHWLPVAAEEVSTTLPVSQKVNGPPADTVGTAGKGLITTAVPVEVAAQLLVLVTDTE